MKLLSWNIQWGRGADGRVDLERTAAAIRAAGAFEVICLQEVASNSPGLPGGGARGWRGSVGCGLFEAGGLLLGALGEILGAPSMAVSRMCVIQRILDR